MALLVGFAGSLPFSNTSLGAELAAHGPLLDALFGSVSRALNGADLAYPVGLALGGGVYLALEGIRALQAVRTTRSAENELIVTP